MTSVEIQHHFYDILSLKVQFLLIVFTLICWKKVRIENDRIVIFFRQTHLQFTCSPLYSAPEVPYIIEHTISVISKCCMYRV